jgi:hypothetical protein
MIQRGDLYLHRDRIQGRIFALVHFVQLADDFVITIPLEIFSKPCCRAHCVKYPAFSPVDQLAEKCSLELRLEFP